jgi:hypothetical protein
MPTTTSTLKTADPYKIFSLCKAVIKPKRIIDTETYTTVQDVTIANTLSNQTVVIKTYDKYVNRRTFELVYDELVRTYPDSVYEKIENPREKNILKIKVTRNGIGSVHFKYEIKRVNLDVLYNFCNKNVDQSQNVLYKRSRWIVIKPNDIQNSKRLADSLIKQLTDQYTDCKFTLEDDGGAYKIIASLGGSGLIRIIKKRGKQSDVLLPGKAYEYYFRTVVFDAMQSLNEWVRTNDWPPDSKPPLMLKVSNDYNFLVMGPIHAVELVASKNRKPDILLYRSNSSTIGISLKQPNFSFWSGADTYNPRFSNRIKSLLDQAIKDGKVQLDGNKVVFPNGVRGIRSKVYDEEEIKYYAFGSSGNSVDYIIIGAKAPKEEIDGSTHIIYMTGGNAYRYNNVEDMKRLKDDFYVVIKKTTAEILEDGKLKVTSPSALKPYEDVTVRYVNRNHAYGSSSGGIYIDV